MAAASVSFDGGCHCGIIRYRLTWPDSGGAVPARACGCRFCRSRRATYTSHPDAVLEARVADEGEVNRYRFGTGTAEFFVCRRCGGMPFAACEIRGRLYAVVNVLTFDEAETTDFQVTVTDFDGEEVEERLERRARNWIPKVDISFS